MVNLSLTINLIELRKIGIFLRISDLLWILIHTHTFNDNSLIITGFLSIRYIRYRHQYPPLNDYHILNDDAGLSIMEDSCQKNTTNMLHVHC